MATRSLLQVMKPTACSLMLAGCCSVLILLSACKGKPMTEGELLGKYELASPHFAGSLELKSDHTFLQKFVRGVNEIETSRGRWDYVPPGDESINRGTVGIYGAIIESEGNLLQKGPDFVVSMPVSINRKGVSLRLNPDGDHAYFKSSTRE